MFKMMSKDELIAKNKATAEKWLKDCPKSYRTKKRTALASFFTHNTLVFCGEGDNCYAMLLSLGTKWALDSVRYCKKWEIDEKARSEHDAIINELRKETPHSRVYSDMGSLRIEADGTELLFGGVGGDGEHRVFFTTREGWNNETLLSLYGHASDDFICTFKCKSLKVFQNDCSGDAVVFERYDNKIQRYNVYNVYDNLRGWKIERHIVEEH